jgi:RDD family
MFVAVKQERVMATYDPPQPMWKRNLAGILDFLLAFFVCAYTVTKIFGTRSDTPDVPQPFIYIHTEDAPYYGLGGWPVLLAFALVIAYFVILGQTGGTVFQRLFSMRRPKSKWWLRSA